MKKENIIEDKPVGISLIEIIKKLKQSEEVKKLKKLEYELHEFIENCEIEIDDAIRKFRYNTGITIDLISYNHENEEKPVSISWKEK